MKSRSFFKVSASTRTAATTAQLCTALPACTSKLKLMSLTVHHPTGHFLDATVPTCM